MIHPMLRRRANSYEKPVGGLYRCLSEDSIIYPEGRIFSNWFGDLTLVTTTTSTDRIVDTSKFDPEKVARRYYVRRAVYRDTNTIIKASERWVGESPILSNDGNFTIGRQINGKRELEGSFIEVEKYWVRQRVGELYPTEVLLLVEYLDSCGTVDVSDINLTAGDWYKSLRKSYTEIQELMPNKAGEISRMVQKLGFPDPVLGWEEIKRRGVYCLTKKRDIVKFVDSRLVDKRSGYNGRNSLYYP